MCLKQDGIARSLLILIVSIIIVIPLSGISAEKTIGIVKDGDSVSFDTMLEQIITELEPLLGDVNDIAIKEVPGFSAGWESSNTRAALRNALEDQDVDLILAMGVLVTNAAAGSDIALNKPVIGTFIQAADTIGLPFNESGRSTKENLNFVAVQSMIEKDLAAYKEMIGFNTVHVLIDEKMKNGLKDLENRAAELENKLDINVEILTMNDSATEVLDKLSGSIEAVYITPAVRMGYEERKVLFRGINDKYIPSFSMIGFQDVQQGVLASRVRYQSTRLARRIALNLQQIMTGTSPNELPVFLPVEERLFLNGATARQIDYTPNFMTIVQAEIINAEALETGVPLTLEQAMRMALEKNVDLAVKKAAVASTEQDSKITRTNLRPQINSTLAHARNDRDTAEFTRKPEDITQVTWEISQLLYNDEASSGTKAQRIGYEGSQFEEETVRLDVIKNAGSSFIRFLKAKTLAKIALDNLRLTRDNLDLARLRQKVGASGPEDVYRWEAQEAGSRSELIRAMTGVEQARIALNQVMGITQDVEWKPADIKLEDEGEFYFLDEKLDGFVDDEDNLDLYIGYTVKSALYQAPELKAVEKGIEAREEMLKFYQRARYSPTVAASFEFNYTIDDTYIGPAAGGPFPDDDSWLAGLQVSFPLYTGGSKKFNIKKAEADLEELTQTYEQVRQLIKLRAHNAVLACSASLPGIRLSRLAADRAEKNLRVIKDKYAQGGVSILALLDAQNQAFVQKQSAAIAVYNYLDDLLEFQRAMAWFETFKTDGEKDAWANELNRLKERAKNY